MKRILLALILCLIVAIPAHAQWLSVVGGKKMLLTLDDSYASSNQDAAGWISTGISGGQMFTSGGITLDNAVFYLSKTGSPGGDLVANVYAKSGTCGSTGIPTGSALATSGTVAASSLGAYALVTFTFAGANRIYLSPGTCYAVEVTGATGDGASNRINMGKDNSSPTHAGNNFYSVSGVYTPDSTSDTIFYVSGYR